MDMIAGTIIISQEKFEEFIKNQVRVDMVCEMLVKKDVPIDEILHILGKDDLVKAYQARRDKEKAELDECWRRYKESQESEGDK